MLKKQITYTDFNGDKQTETFYFHLSKADLIQMEVSRKGGMEKWLERIVEANDGAAILNEVRGLILMAYGKKTEDGRGFIKNQATREEFESSEAFSTLLMEVCTDADKLADFFNGIIPHDLAQEVAQMTSAKETPDVPVVAAKSVDEVEARRNVFEKTAKQRMLSRAEVIEMDHDELTSGLAEGRYVIGPGE